MHLDSHSNNNITQLEIGELRQQWAIHWGVKPHWRIGRRMLESSLAFKQREMRGEGMTPEQRKRLDNLVAQYKRDPKSFDQGPAGLKPGTKLVRAYQGKKHIVLVKADGFEYRKQRYGIRAGGLRGRKTSSASSTTCSINPSQWSLRALNSRCLDVMHWPSRYLRRH